MRHTLLILLGLTVIVIATSWSLIHPQLFKVHDYVHAARVAEMARGLQDGQIPVRWSANFGYGYGMPLFEFYAPLPYFVGAVLWLVHIPIDIVIKLLFLIPSIITVYAAYRLGKLWFSSFGSVLLAAAIALAPYRAVNLYVRGAVAESWGMAFFVVSLLGVGLVVRKTRSGWLVLLAGLTGMVLSHNLTTLMAILALLIWTATLILLEVRNKITLKTLCKQLVPKLLCLGLLALGLTAFYWLPALAEKQYTKMDSTILTGYFDFRLHFLYLRQFFTPFWGYGGSNWGPDDGISFFLGFGQLFGAALTVVAGVLAIVALVRKKTAWTKLKPFVLLAVGSLGIIAISLFLSLQRSQSIWESISFLAIIQFPWRFLAIASTLLGFFSVLWLLRVRTIFQVILGSLMFALLLSNARYFQPSEYLTQSSDLYYTDAQKIQSDMSGILPDFIPSQLSLTVPPTELVHCVNPSQCSNLEILIERSDERLVQLKLASHSTVLLSTASYPGWKLEVDGIPQSVTTSENGLLSVSVPEGTHKIGWYLGNTTLRTAAYAVSVASLLVLVYLCINNFYSLLFVDSSKK